MLRWLISKQDPRLKNWGYSYIYFATVNDIFTYISPEGCASILYKDASKASTAAESLKITSSRLKDEGLIDSIISEPLGEAHHLNHLHQSPQR
jgi:acetyl-CoA carboxylase alpha subunit